MPLVRTLFFAARPFRPCKNVSLAPRVPMSTFSKPPEPIEQGREAYLTGGAKLRYKRLTGQI